MGYDLHITRKAHWSDPDGPTISLAEWQQLVDEDADLTPYVDVGQEDVGKVASYGQYGGSLWWDDGEIRSQNPEKPLVIKMVAIAEVLGAAVQGDDGELYRADGTSYDAEPPAPPPAPGLLERIRSWFRARRTLRELQQAAPPFKVGSRVRNVFGESGTVLEVDARANGGIGRVRVRLDDGREQSFALVASGLKIDGGTAGGS